MAETNKPKTAQVQSTDKTMLVVVIVFGSVITLLLTYIALRVSVVGPRHPQLNGQMQQRLQQQGGVRLNQQPIDNSQSDPMNFNEEMNLN